MKYRSVRAGMKVKFLHCRNNKVLHILTKNVRNSGFGHITEEIFNGKLNFCAALVSNEMPSIFANKCPVLVSI